MYATTQSDFSTPERLRITDEQRKRAQFDQKLEMAERLLQKEVGARRIVIIPALTFLVRLLNRISQKVMKVTTSWYNYCLYIKIITILN